MTTVVILQSNYIPWRGYFDLIRRADHFVLYDTVQFTKNDWRNRNRIVGTSGPQWLTIPVATSGQFGQTIDQTTVSDPRWTRRHANALQSALGRAPRFSALGPVLGDLYSHASGMLHLSIINRFFIEAVMSLLGLTTRLHDAREFEVAGDRTGRLVSICRALGATRYLSGPAARDYLDTAAFAAVGIEVDWMTYPAYPAYRQMDGHYQAGVSILDTLASLDPKEVFG